MSNNSKQDFHRGMNHKNSTHARVVKDYFSLTSSSAINFNDIDFPNKSSGIRRGLGDWLDVRGKIVLDLGCGTGEFSWLACDEGASEVVGVNLSEEELSIACQHVSAKFFCMDILEYLGNCSAESVDRIYALNILEHLDIDYLVSVLEQMHRILRNDGQVVAMVPNATSPFGVMTRYWDITHCLAFTPSSVRQLQRLCGYDDVEFREWGPKPHGIISTIRFAFWHIIRFMIRFRLMIETGSSKGSIYTADMLFRLKK